MDEPPFFQPADDFDLPSGGGADPIHKRAPVAGIAQRTRSHHTHYLRPGSLSRLMEALQNFNRARQGRGREDAALENRFA